MEITKTEARVIYEVFRNKDLFNHILSFIPTAQKPNHGLVMIYLGDVWWVKKEIRAGKTTFKSKPKVTNKFMDRLLDEEWVYANDLLQSKNINKLAQAIVDNKVIYTDRPLMNCAAFYKQFKFINWLNGERPGCRVVILL
jgi:hypothetical protein